MAETKFYGKPLAGVMKSSLKWRAESARGARTGKAALNLEDLYASPDVVDPKRCVSPRSREALLQCGVLASELKHRDVAAFLGEARGDPELAAIAHTRYDAKRLARIERVVLKRRDIIAAEEDAIEAEGSPGGAPRGTLYQQALTLQEGVVRKLQAGEERRQSARLQGASERMEVVHKGYEFYSREESSRREAAERKRQEEEQARANARIALEGDRRDGAERARQQAYAEAEAERERQRELKHENKRREEEMRSARALAAHEAEVERKAAEARAAHEATRRRMAQNNEALEERRRRLIRKAEKEEQLRLSRVREEEAKRAEQKERADMMRAIRLDSAKKRDEMIQQNKLKAARQKQRAEDARWKQREEEVQMEAQRKAERNAARDRQREAKYQQSIERLQNFQRATMQKMQQQDEQMALSLQRRERKRELSAFEKALREAERRAGVKERERANQVKRTVTAEKLEFAMDRVNAMVEAREAVARQRHVDHITQSVLAEKLEFETRTSLILRKGSLMKSALKSAASSYGGAGRGAFSTRSTPGQSRPSSGTTPIARPMSAKPSTISQHDFAVSNLEFAFRDQILDGFDGKRSADFEDQEGHAEDGQEGHAEDGQEGHAEDGQGGHAEDGQEGLAEDGQDQIVLPAIHDADDPAEVPH